MNAGVTHAPQLHGRVRGTLLFGHSTCAAQGHQGVAAAAAAPQRVPPLRAARRASIFHAWTPFVSMSKHCTVRALSLLTVRQHLACCVDAEAMQTCMVGSRHWRLA